MRVLDELQTARVGGGIQFVAYADQYEAARDWIDSAGGGWITSGSIASSGSSSAGSSSGGYGSNLVNPALCKIDVDNAGAIGSILGGLLGVAVGGARGGFLGAAGGGALGGTAGFGLGQLYGSQTSPNCKPKTSP